MTNPLLAVGVSFANPPKSDAFDPFAAASAGDTPSTAPAAPTTFNPFTAGAPASTTAQPATPPAAAPSPFAPTAPAGDGLRDTPDIEPAPIRRIGDPVTRRTDLAPGACLPVPARHPVTLPSGRKTTDVPGLPDFPMPGPIREFQPERDRYGRYMMPDPVTGKVYGHTRATTLAHSLESVSGSTALADYDRRMILRGLMLHPEIVEGFDTTLLDTEKENDLRGAFRRLAEQASYAGGSADKREFGTALHAWTEALDHGQLTFDAVPEMFREYVAVYEQALAASPVEVLAPYVERIVCNQDTGTIGTADRIFRYNGELVIGDIKTSSNIQYSWGEISSQLAQYADAGYIWSEDGTHWEPMPEVNKHIGIIAEVPSLSPSGKIYCTLHVIDLDYGREMNRIAVEAKEALKNPRKRVPKEQLLTSCSPAEAVTLLESGAVRTGPDAAAKTGTPAPAGVPVPPATPETPADESLSVDEITAALAAIGQAITVDELNAMFRPVWQTDPAGAQLMDAANARANAILANNNLRNG